MSSIQPSTSASQRASNNTRETQIVAAYQRETLRLVLLAARSYAELTQRGATPSELVNFLRGTRAPPEGAGSPAVEIGPSYGILEATRARWLEAAFESLLEEGLLETSPGSSARWVLSRSGSLALSGRATLQADLFPRPPRLGEHPTCEGRLRRLRAEIAAREGHSAYVVFPNSVLAQLCAVGPRSLADLAEIPGLGEVRVRRYGRRILAALKTSKTGATDRR